MSGADVPVLELERLSLAYGETVVVRDVSLKVRAGEVYAVMGPNGAGKTTLLNGIVGMASRVEGSIVFDGEPLERINPQRAAKRRIAYVPQGRQLFPYASGRMNLWSGGYGRRDRGRLEKDIDDFIAAWPVAARVAKRNAEVMSGGEQQVIAIGRGALSKPRLMLIDEPSLGLAPILVQEVFKLIADVASDASHAGAAVVLVEQNVEAALSVADHVCILSGGQVVHQGARGDLTAADIGDMYLH